MLALVMFPIHLLCGIIHTNYEKPLCIPQDNLGDQLQTVSSPPASSVCEQ